MQIRPNLKIQQTLEQIFNLPQLPPMDLPKYRDTMLAQGRSFTTSDEEFKEFEAQLLDYVDSDARAALQTVEAELKKDPLYYYKTFTEQRWN